uniref:crystal protein-like isoform X2 n=1 Tax=Styela clava TaxID=7725 RepID=UPI00193A31A4|nr:crystal protein-like isoform X2 [Styela clava]
MKVYLFKFSFIQFILLVSSEQYHDLVSTTASQGISVGEVTPEAGIFWGIPFSQPPVGKYRWRKPRPPLNFSGDYWNATYARPGCPQTCVFKKNKYRCVLKTSENCLHLNVFVPRKILTKSTTKGVVGHHHYVIKEDVKNNKSKALAVMVFVHGGNYVHDSASQVIYDSRYLAHRGDVIVVSFDYRLGPLGFLVQGEGKDAALGNYGLWDAIKAFEWVKKNIQYFGGNPDMITAFGQSSGAESLSILLTTSHGNDLFHRAILESDPLSLPFKNMTNAKDFGNRFARKIGCTAGDLKCLRGVDVEKIVSSSSESAFSIFSKQSILQQGQQWGPVIDKDLLYEYPINAFEKGRFRKIPMIIGGNSADGYQYAELLFSGFKISQFMYQLSMDVIFKSNANSMLKQYPPNCCDNTKQLTEIITDYVFLCPERSAMFRTEKDSWFYIYGGTLPFKSLWAFKGCVNLACHGADIGSVFNPAPLTNYHQSKKEYYLARRVEYYWTNFAKYGNPNGAPKKHGQQQDVTNDVEKLSIVQWDRFHDTNIRDYNTIEFSNNGDKMRKNVLKKKCDFWDNLNLYGKL